MTPHTALRPALALLLVSAAAAAQPEPEGQQPPPVDSAGDDAPAAPPPAAEPAPAAAAVPTPAFGFGATAYPPAAVSDRGAEPKPPREKPPVPRWQVFAGMRGAFVDDGGYNLFSERDFAGQGSVWGARTVYHSGDVSIAGALAFAASAHDSTIRGERTSLALYRLTLGPEVRLHFAPELYVYARPSAGVLRSVATLDESTTGSSLHSNGWLVAIDAFAGVAADVLDLSGERGELRFWVAAEGGYGWTSATDLRFLPDEDDASAPNRVAALDLGSLAQRGPGFRLAIGASF